MTTPDWQLALEYAKKSRDQFGKGATSQAQVEAQWTEALDLLTSSLAILPRGSRFSEPGDPTSAFDIDTIADRVIKTWFAGILPSV